MQVLNSLLWLFCFLRLTYTIPPVPYCNDSGWFHGYQGLGITYSVIDTQLSSTQEQGAIIIGGSVPSGCSTLQPGTTFLNDKCAIVEYFSTSTAVSPSATFLLGSFPMTGYDLGITGIYAMKLAYTKATAEIFGILTIGSGQAYTSQSSMYVPDGTELALFTAKVVSSSQVTVNYFYIQGKFHSYKCGLTTQNIELISLSTTYYLAFSSCDASDQSSYIVVFTGATPQIQTITKFSNQVITQWYAITSAKNRDSAIFVGLSADPGFVWLALGSTAATAATSPQCAQIQKYSDTAWIQKMGTQVYYPVQVLQAFASGLNTVVVFETNPYSGIAIVVTDAGRCPQSQFKIGWFGQRSTSKPLQLKLLDIRVYHTSTAKMDMLVQDQITGDVYQLLDMYLGSSLFLIPTPTNLLKLTSLSPNPAFTLSPSIFKWSKTITPGTALNEIVALGVSTLYSNGTSSDGFLVRADESSTKSCFKYATGTFDYRSDWTGTITNTFYPTGATDLTSNCNIVNAGTTSSTTLLTLNTNFKVFNPCYLTVSVTTSSYTVYFGQSAQSITLIPKIQLCPITQTAAAQFDSSLIQVISQNSLDTTTQILQTVANPATPNLIYTLDKITNTSLVGTWNAKILPKLYGEIYPISLQLSLTILVKYCDPILTQIPLNYSSSTLVYQIKSGFKSFSLQNNFTNGNCTYQTSVPINQFWSAISTYTPEQYTSNSYVITSQTVYPSFSINTDSILQNQAGTYNYIVNYVDYSGVLHTLTQSFQFTQSDCFTTFTGIPSTIGQYTQVIGDTTPLSIDISAVANSECQFTFLCTQLSSTTGLSLTSTLTQPTFTNTNTLVYIKASNAQLQFQSLSVSAGKPYLGLYNFSLDFTSGDKTAAKTSWLFSVTVQNCHSQFSTQTWIQNQTYTLGDIYTLSTPAFVTSLCNQLQVNLTVSQLTDFSGLLTFTQVDAQNGSSNLTLNSQNLTYLGSYQLTFTATDTYWGEQTTMSLNLTVDSICRSSVITTPPMQNQIIQQTGDLSVSFSYPWTQFTQQIENCNTFNYTVTFKTLSGDLTQDWFTVDYTNRSITLNQLANLTQSSTVNITIKGQLFGSAKLPSASTTYNLTVSPYFVVPTKLTNKTSPQTSQQSSSNNQTTTQNNATDFSILDWLRSQTNLTKPEKSKTPPKTWISAFTRTGLVTVKFSKPLLIPQPYLNVSQRILEKNYTESFDQVLALSVNDCKQNGLLNRTKILKFNLTDFQKSHFILQVDFAFPSELSTTVICPDYLTIDFLVVELFLTEDFVFLANSTKLNAKIPTQLTKAEEKKIAAIEAVAEKSMVVISATSLVVNIVLTIGLKYVWNVVNLLQFLIYIQTWELLFPQNALAFLKYIKSLALLEFIPVKSILTTVSTSLGFDPDAKDDFIGSTGVMLVLLVGILVFAVAIVFGVFLFNTNYKMYSRFRQLEDKIYYNAFLRYFIQSILKLALAACGTLAAVTWSNLDFKTAVSISVQIIILTLFIVSPILFYKILDSNYQKLVRPSMKAKIGSLYLAIKERSRYALCYSQVFIVRRILFVCVSVLLSGHASIQIHLFTFTSLFYLMFLGTVGPYQDNFMTAIEIVNETLLLLVCYQFMLYTDVVQNAALRSAIGWSQVGLVVLIISLNFCVILNTNLQVFKRKFYLERLRSEYRERQRSWFNRSYHNSNIEQLELRKKFVVPLVQNQIYFQDQIQVVQSRNEQVMQENISTFRKSLKIEQPQVRSTLSQPAKPNHNKSQLHQKSQKQQFDSEISEFEQFEEIKQQNFVRQNYNVDSAQKLLEIEQANPFYVDQPKFISFAQKQKIVQTQQQRQEAERLQIELNYGLNTEWL